MALDLKWSSKSSQDHSTVVLPPQKSNALPTQASDTHNSVGVNIFTHIYTHTYVKVHNIRTHAATVGGGDTDETHSALSHAEQL